MIGESGGKSKTEGKGESGRLVGESCRLLGESGRLLGESGGLSGEPGKSEVPRDVAAAGSLFEVCGVVAAAGFTF